MGHSDYLKYLPRSLGLHLAAICSFENVLQNDGESQMVRQKIDYLGEPSRQYCSRQ